MEEGEPAASDAACVWILASPIAMPHKLNEKARIYRALVTNIDSLSRDLSNLLKYQSQIKTIDSIWFSSVNEPSVVSELAVQCNALLKDDDCDAIQQFQTEFVAGKQNEKNIWVSIALAMMNGVSKCHDSLIVSQSENKILIAHWRT